MEKQLSELRVAIDTFTEGNARNEALETVSEIEKTLMKFKTNQDKLLFSTKELIKLCNVRRDEIINLRQARRVIDFGTGKLYYNIEEESAVTVKELMDAINEAAMIVPLPELIEAINRTK